MFANTAPDSGPHFDPATGTTVAQVVCFVLFLGIGGWALLGDRQKYRRRWLVAWAFLAASLGMGYWYNVRDAEFREEICRQRAAPPSDPAR